MKPNRSFRLMKLGSVLIFFEENQILEDQGRILESLFKVDEQNLSHVGL